MNFSEPERCELCGNTEKRDLRFALVHWRDAEPGMAYDHVGACRDRDACRLRVMQLGESWPLVESANERGAA